MEQIPPVIAVRLQLISRIECLLVIVDMPTQFGNAADDNGPDKYEYPFNSDLYDPQCMNGYYIQYCVARIISFTRATRLHHMSLMHSSSYANSWAFLGERKISDLVALGQQSSSYLFLVPLEGQQRLGINRSTFVSLLEFARIPPHFVEVVANNNGVCTGLWSLNEEIGNTNRLELFIKIPFAPVLNGGIYFSLDVRSAITKIMVIFEERILDRLKEVLAKPPGKDSGAPSDPFLTLATVITESVLILEERRRKVDEEVQSREAATGVTLLSWHPKKEATMDAYPLLFDLLHLCQQELMYMKCSTQYLTRLVKELQEQHNSLLNLRIAAAKDNDKTKIRFQGQKVINSFKLSESQIKHMDYQVGTLSLRISTQLSIVESRLRQSNAVTQVSMARTQVVISEATKQDGMAMRTIAAVTMLFLPGTFTASLFAMPFFKMDGRFSVSKWFGLYVAVTVPLTVLVVVIWLVWQQILSRGLQMKKAEDPERNVLKIIT